MTILTSSSFLQTYSAEEAKVLLDQALADAIRIDKTPISKHDKKTTLLPGIHTLGILGGGQLGRYFLISAKERGYRTVVWCDKPRYPSKHLADICIEAPFTDKDALDHFATEVDAVTLEFENIPLQLVLDLEAKGVRVRPSAKVLAICQNRELERRFLVSQGIDVAPHVIVTHGCELEEAFIALGETSCVLKTTRLGYDGRGQRMCQTLKDIKQTWKDLKGSPENPMLLEKCIGFKREVSMLIARGMGKSVRLYPLIENIHIDGILDTSIMPAPNTSVNTLVESEHIATKIAKALDYMGLLCIEFFEMDDGSLLVNELAPRPHNSGHLTIEACHASQYDQQLYALTGLRLRNPSLQVKCAGMMNILADRWPDDDVDHVPNWVELYERYARIKLHLYGKNTLSKGRKMGHITLTGNTPDMLNASLKEIDYILGRYS